MPSSSIRRDEIRLPVLHAVFAGLETAAQAIVHVHDTGVFRLAENRVNDLLNRLVLENAAVAFLGQHPEPGHNSRAVFRKSGGHQPQLQGGRTGLGEGTENPIDVTFALIGEDHNHSGGLADHRLEVNFVVGGVHEQLKLK
jgi:hypothetical protein